MNGTYEGAGGGVEHGGPPQPDYPRPGATPVDRDLLQTQLQARQLPSGKFHHAVAGYLYFPRSAAKNAAGVSETVDLPVPAKTR